MFIKFDKSNLNLRDLEQRRFTSGEVSMYQLMLRFFTPFILVILLASCSISGGGGGNSTGQDTALRGEPITPPPPLQSSSPVDANGNGFLELWYPTHLLALTDSDNNISLPLNGSYELMTNISLTEYLNWRPLGNSTHPFTGTFDGRGYSISEISSTDYDYAGLFGVTDRASIINLNIHQVNVWGNQYAGALAGLVESTNISNVVVDLGMGHIIVAGDHNAGFSDYAAGGIVGYSESSNLDALAILGTGSVKSYEKFATSRRTGYSAGGLAGKSMDSIYNNSTLDARLDIISGNEHSRGSNSLGSIIGELNESSIINAYVNFNGQLLAQGLNSYNYAGGLVGEMYNSVIQGVTATINSSIIASPIEYSSRLLGDFSVGGIIGYGARLSDISDIDIYLAGDLIANNTHRDYYSSVGGLIGSDGLESATNINIKVDGDLIGIGSYNEISGLGSVSQNMANISLLVNGNLISKAYNREISHGSAIGVISPIIVIGEVTNISAVINGDILSESSISDNYIGLMIGVSYWSAAIRDSSVLINGSINVLGVDNSGIKFGGFASDPFAANLSIENSYVHITGQVTINTTSSTNLPNNLNIGYVLGGSLDESPAEIINSYFAMDNPLAIYVNDVLAPEYFGGAVGISSTMNNLLIQDSYYHIDIMTDSLTPPFPNNIVEYRDYIQLRCPTRPREHCGSAGNSLTNYINWDENKWDFGSNTELPILRR